MKKSILLSAIVLFVACKQNPKKTSETVEIEAMEVIKDKPSYPKYIQKVIDAHGGLEVWKQQRTLSFVLPKPDNPETHTTDLWSRNEKIITPNYMLGFDGKPWVVDINKNYKGNPEFYHNLMFYFYAMPFVLADEGINYSKAEDLVFEDATYPGITIAYNSGVGISPKDNYYIHYNQETYQMEWLGYTVTYQSGEKSNDVRWIRYNDWQNINGLVLPNSISWYTVQDGAPIELRNQVVFENVTLSKEPKPIAFYHKPEMGEYWVKPEQE